ncbi:MAG: hypothetical protein WA633_24660, partial [Stellaceae bacterium]
MRRWGFTHAFAALVLLSQVAVLGQAVGQETAAPARPEEPAEQVQVEGIRSAHWGMTEAQVKAAIRKDFNIPPEKVQTAENPSEKTTVLT